MSVRVRETSSAPAGAVVPSARRLDVQGLRAVAVLLVVAYHADLPLPGGFTGVDVFFVVSGFVITGLIKREIESPEGFSFRRFYARRVRRLLPALALLIASVAVLSTLIDSPAGTQQVTLRTGIAAALSLANIEIYRTTGGYFDLPAAGNPLLHTWSLSVEEQFYLAFPLVLFLLLRFARGRGRTADRGPRIALATAVLLGLAAISFVLAHVLVGGRTLPGIALPAQFAFYASPARGWEFLAGAVIALLAGLLTRVPRVFGTLLGAAGVVLIALAGWKVTDTSGVPAAPALLPVLGAAAIIAGGTVSANLVSKALALPWMVKLGDLSYSFYLWHWPMIVFAKRLFPSAPTIAPIAGALVGFALSVLAYRLVENPIHKRRRIPTWSGLRIGLVSTAVALAALGAQFGVREVMTQQAGVAAYVDAATAGHYADEQGCDVAESIEAPRPPACDVTVPGAEKTVYLLGDSQAGHFSESVLGAAEKLGWNVSIATANGCPYAGTLVSCTPTRPTVAAIVERPPGIVIFATEIDGWITRPDILVPPPPPATLPREQRITLWVEQMRTLTDPLVQAGHRVLLMQPTPRFNNWAPGDCLGIVAYVKPAACGTSTSRAEAERWRADAVEAQLRLAEAPGVEVLDVFDRFCDASRCYTNSGSDWYARNVDHISAAMAHALVPDFEAAFRRASSW